MTARKWKLKILANKVKTMDDLIWISKNLRKEMIEKTHKLLFHAGPEK